MLYQGKHISVVQLDNDIIEFTFAGKASVNKFDQETFSDFKNALMKIKTHKNAKGLLITSSKSNFIVGADINEFLDTFALPENELITWIKAATDTFDMLEDLNLPTVVAINGFALGGGCEFILSCDYRIADTSALIGLPEVTLGIMPGFGGTVRLPRLIGVDNAAQWISTGKTYKAFDALSAGVVDAVVEPINLRDAALHTLNQAMLNQLDWRAKRQPKLMPLTLSSIERTMSFATCKSMILAKAGQHYPAPVMMINTLEAAAQCHRSEAMAIENKNFAKLAKTPEATAQVGLFLADQVIKSKAKKATQLVQTTHHTIEQAAVLGAGIMGGGIAYQSAYKNIPIIMKDIEQKALDLGLSTAANILTKLHSRDRLSIDKMAHVLNNITPTLGYNSLHNVDVVIEAVIENIEIKKTVLAEVESCVPEKTILTSNTSTISIDILAQDLQRKDKFCGMHFFNPVNRMPLVEVIRGSETSDETVAAVVAYASQIGKSAIVVNDCPGFYVNRVLFPYLAGFSQLLLAGAEFKVVDKVMKKEFGWPMGPAHLLDVIGIDTAAHCIDVMAEGFPTRMAKISNDPISLLFKHGHYGQKSGHGFYQHSVDKKGKPVITPSEAACHLISESSMAHADISPENIIARLMIPMVNEVVRCLEEGVVDTAYEADMALIYGLGFPPFRGGPIRYLETFGIDKFIECAEQLSHLGEIYQVTDGMRAMAREGKSYFNHDVKKSLLNNSVNSNDNNCHHKNAS